jgi:photosystem II stability/assembly factor-like uncharacterized protein
MKKVFLFIISCWLFSSGALAQWVNQPATQSFTGNVYSISVVNPQVIWAITADNQLIRTTDGGANWAISSFAPAIGFANAVTNCISAIDANTAWITATGTNPLISGVFKTTNGGQTWTRQTSAYAFGSDAKNIHFFDSNHGVTMGDPTNGYFEIYTTSNGGQTWNRVPQANLPPPGTNDASSYGNLFVVSGNTIWIPVWDQRILRSDDKGLTWTMLHTGSTQFPIYNMSYGLAFKDLNNGLALSNGELRKTTDGGLTWSAVAYTGPVFFFLTYVPGTPNTYVSTGIIPASSPGSSYSTDGGQTWRSLESTIVHWPPAFTSPSNGWTGGMNTLHKFTSTVLNVKEAQEVSDIRIFPNPGNGIFTIMHAFFQPVTFEVYSITSKLVLKQTETQTRKSVLDLTNQPKGIYLVKVSSGKNTSIQKLILQ